MLQEIIKKFQETNLIINVRSNLGKLAATGLGHYGENPILGKRISTSFLECGCNFFFNFFFLFHLVQSTVEGHPLGNQNY